MRYIMKGGVWKNSQDQILKAAIMKYGLNQWSRISSLLQRKSAKQCKQRWYEWLDPSIKKTQWTRTEDQKLLQLARVFPSQWRTIAPFVGRTPTQCYDRYQKLLDIAQGKNPNDPNDLRKLRPGEIDPNPQTKPARPDPIDMDQDQKEMLAEVRVRLANTKGKKAKRKQREKMIDQARRLAQLQKARQLKMAGVENIMTQQQLKRLKKRNDINYNKEVPFKREVPEFAYKAESSQTPTNSAFALNISLQTLEGKRRDVEQQLMRKMDKRRLRKFRQRDLTAAILQRREIAMPPPVPISLPQPQLADKDLEELKKLNITTPLNTQLINQTPIGMTPENKILFSARVNLSLNYNQMRQNPNDQQVDGIEGLKYLKTLEKEAFKRNFQNSIKPISERMKTPINEWQKSDEGKLQRLFKSLRKPQNIIQFEIPEQEEEQEKEEIMDAQEYQRLQNIKQQKLLQQKLKNRSSTLKKELPRFKIIPEKIYYHQRNNALMEIENQYISLVYSDANDYPLEGMQFPERQIAYKQNIEQDLINEANLLIRIEQKKFNNPYEIDFITSSQIRNKIKLDFQNKNVEVTEENNRISNQKGIYSINLPQYQLQHKKTENMEKKCSVLLAGFQKKLKEKTKEINQLLLKLQSLRIQRETLEQLRLHEQYSIRARLEQLQTYYTLIYESI